MKHLQEVDLILTDNQQENKCNKDNLIGLKESGKTDSSKIYKSMPSDKFYQFQKLGNVGREASGIE